MLEFLGLYGVAIFIGLLIGGFVGSGIGMSAQNGVIGFGTFLVILMIVVGINHVILNETQTGVRMKKDVQSNLAGGLKRTISVIENEQEIYFDKGTFDIYIDEYGKVKYEKIMEKDTQRVILLPSKFSTVIIKEDKGDK